MKNLQNKYIEKEKKASLKKVGEEDGFKIIKIRNQIGNTHDFLFRL